MSRLLKQFSAAMDANNRVPAAEAGMGQLYDEAMKEWHKGATAAEKAKIYQKWMKKAALYLALGGGATYAVRRGAVGAIQDLWP